MKTLLNIGKVLSKSEQQFINGGGYQSCTCDPCDVTCTSSGICPVCPDEDQP
ncbi:hypothetical protein [Aquimarina intermedia]|uniref:Uncharacterized protein n=1 Tax=Aquimarina intermedia TaxID=350814 RepID=A0A5S5C510_9FLAO|nr:hypothetical protein [Aquimarina intermedia]TYP74397.1 hypothetical protein BD809_104217 [Aquimarina intermedia]